MRITLLSNHWYLSPRRAGFHHMADSLQQAGHSVTFVTVGLSLLSYARGDYRTKYKGLRSAHNELQTVCPNLDSYVFFTHWHPHTLGLPLLDKLTHRLVDTYEELMSPVLQNILRLSEVVLYESCSGLFLYHAARRLAPGAKHIYRVSDDIRLLRSTHPRMLELEQEIAPFFDAVSVPCAAMLEKFPALPHLHLHRHGINKAAFDVVQSSPYALGTRNAVLVSAWRTDSEFFRAVAKGCPKIHFHCIGPLANTVQAPNIHYLGEMPFAQTLAYIKFADMGLQIVKNMGASTATLTDNLKVIQYRYCGLPIVAPAFLDLNREGVFYYNMDPHSCVIAVQQALQHGKNPAFATEVRTWEELCRDLLACVNY